MFSKPFDLLLGRKTYDIFAAHWPYAGPDDPIGPLFDRITKYVATRNPDLRLDWQNSRTLGSDPVAMLKKLKSEEGPDLLTQGSTDFLQTLFSNDLVDEMYISYFPVVLGKGKRLFGHGAMPMAMKLPRFKSLRDRRHRQQIRPQRPCRNRFVRVRAADRSGTGAAKKAELIFRFARAVAKHGAGLRPRIIFERPNFRRPSAPGG